MSITHFLPSLKKWVHFPDAPIVIPTGDDLLIIKQYRRPALMVGTVGVRCAEISDVTAKDLG